jgi:hypothetical protein
MSTQTGAMTSHPFGTGQFDPFKPLTYDFDDFTDDGGPDRSLHPGVDFGPYLFCFNTTYSQLVGDVTADVVNQVLNCPSHGLVNGNQVRFDSDGVLPLGLFFATYYFVVNATANTFQVSSTSGGTPITLGDAGSGHHVVTKRGTPLDMTGWSVWAWVKALASDPDANKLLDLAPTILTPTNLGTVQIKVLHGVTTALVSASAFWDMIGQDAAGNRVGRLAQGIFSIAQIMTHPP